MKQRSLAVWLSLFAVFVLAIKTAASAQESTETLALTVGDILEILPVHSLSDAKYAWILTQDRSFLQAERSPAFRTRLIQPGAYLLVAEITSAAPAQTLRRTFRLDVAARESAFPESSPGTAGSGAILVTTDPLTQTDSRIVLPEGRQTMRLAPINPDRKPLSLDLDAARDTNGDGSPGNDVDNEGTFFQIDATPIHLWFAEPFTTRSVAVTTVGADGNPVVQTVNVLSFAFAKEQGLTATPGRIVAIPQDESSFEFSVAFDEPTGDVSLLYHWQFGDGAESLVTRPVHAYQTSGDFPVTVSVRNLVTGKEVASYSTQVRVTSVAPPPTDGGTTPPVDDGNDAGGGLTLSTFFWPVILLLGVLLLGGVAYVVLRFLRNRKPLHETLAQMEETMVPKEAPAAAAPPPLVIESKKTKELPETEQKADAGAPVWLKKGLDQAPAKPAPAAPPPSTPKPVTPPAPPPKTATPPPPSAPPPKPVTPPTPPSPVQDKGLGTKDKGTSVASQALSPQSPSPSPQTAPLPAWLQKPPAPPAAPAPLQPKPAPAAATTPAIQKPVTAPAATPPVQPKAAVPQNQTPPSTPSAKPASAAPAPKPQEQYQTPPPPTPAPRTSATPKPAPAPAATPVPPPQPKAQPTPPKPASIPAQPKQSAPPAPPIPTPPAAKPAMPAPTPTPKAPDDPTIAVIRAESLEAQKKNDRKNS